jgi:hypothetical protein
MGSNTDFVTDHTATLSVVVPCYNEAINVPIFYERLRTVLDGEGIQWG